MRIVNLNIEATLKVQDAAPGLERHDLFVRYRDDIKRSLDAPIDLKYIKKVEYDVKTDRYVATFMGNSDDPISKVKVTTEVAEFLMENLYHPGHWWGRMKNGELVDVNLFEF